jgi:hypothetical protein
MSVFRRFFSTFFVLVLIGCSDSSTSPPGAKPDSATLSTLEPHIVEYAAIGMKFSGPDKIPSGWTTFRFNNTSGMVHFGILDYPPPGITLREFSPVMTLFQEAMDAMNAGDEESANAAFGKFPAWMAELGRRGGPGFLSPGLTGETTVFLEPGHYILECYVKTQGTFHTTSPGDGLYGMVLEIEVTDDKVNAPEPLANATVTVRNNGYEITGGSLTAGRNSIRVVYEEQQAFPSVVGNDIHVIRVDGPEAITMAADWMDWRKKNGLETPSPVTFLGGVNDMPAGSTAYFSVDLSPGDYAFIAEVPEPLESGHVLPFTIN